MARNLQIGLHGKWMVQCCCSAYLHLCPNSKLGTYFAVAVYLLIFCKYGRFGSPRKHLETDICDVGKGSTNLMLSNMLDTGEGCSRKWRIILRSLKKRAKCMLCNWKGDCRAILDYPVGC